MLTTVRLPIPRHAPPRAEASPGVSRRRSSGWPAAAALLVGFCVPMRGQSTAAAGAAFAPNAFIRIDRQGDVTLVMPQVEMGQGTYTSISMILAEELDADWGRVQVEHAPPDEKLYANPMLSIAGHGQLQLDPRLLEAAAQGRRRRQRLLVSSRRAAALGMSRGARCRTENGKVIHDPTGRKARLRRSSRPRRGDHAAEGPAAQRPQRLPADRPAAEAPGHARQDQRQGQVRHRRHAARREVRHARRRARCSAARSRMSTTSAARRVPGVRQIVVLDDLVAVVGDHMWAAKCGLEALRSTWNDGPNAEVSSDMIWSQLRSASPREGAVAKEVGDVAQGARRRGGLERRHRRLRDAAAGARLHGAVELHGACHADVGRGLDRHAGDGARPRRRRQGRRACRKAR